MPSGGPSYGANHDGIGPNPDIEQRASGQYTDPRVEAESNNLHAGIGQECSHCHKAIKKDQPVRRTVAGDYVHDVC
jgi:hypothetical protein